MKRPIAIVLLSFLLSGYDGPPVNESGQRDPVRILITIADRGIARPPRAGPPGPTYRRRLADYVASPGVRRQARKLEKEYLLKFVDEWPIVALDVHCVVFELAIGTGVDELLHELNARDDIDSAQLLNRFDVSGKVVKIHGDPYAHLQHTLDTLELRQAHRWSVGTGTDITVIDTGADLSHPDLVSQISAHRDFAPDTERLFSSDAHGTAVAGIISASSGNGIGTIGIAPEAQLTVLRACWYEREQIQAVCNSFTLAKALSFAIENDTNIINLSLGGPSDNLLERLTVEALRRGIVVIAAAPGGNAAMLPGFPAALPGVISVRAFERQAGDGENPRLGIGAPGQDILVLAPRDKYDYVTGSSMAAAHVSGIVSLLLSKRADLTAAEIRALLTQSQLSSMNSVNACRALSQLLQKRGCRDEQRASVSPQAL